MDEPHTTALPGASLSLPKIWTCWLIFTKFAKVMGSSEDKNLFPPVFAPQGRLPRELHEAGTHQPAWESHELPKAAPPCSPAQQMTGLFPLLISLCQ